MPQKTKAEIAAEKAALKESWEVVKLENEFDRAMNEGKDPNPFEVKAKKRSKGGEPIKAVLGVAVLATKKGKDTLKKFLKGKKEVAAASPGMAAIPTTMNKGGGMDMGKKEEPTQWITKKEKPTQWITKKEKPKKWITKKSRGGGMDMGQMPNTVKPRPRGNPGVVETVVGKGGDYIKDLID